MNRMPKYVVSSSSEDLGWSNSHWIEGDVGSAGIKLKRDIGADLVVFGSAALVLTRLPDGGCQRGRRPHRKGAALADRR